MEALLNGCQADGPQCIVSVGLVQSLHISEVLSLVLSEVFTDKMEVKKKKKEQQSVNSS